MATQVKHRRGTQSEIDNFTPAIAEIVVNTSESELVLGDGVTEGGVPIAKKRNTVLSFDTLTVAIANTSLKEGYVVELKERSTGNGGGGKWDVVLASTVTPSPDPSYGAVVQCTGVPTLALVLKVDAETDQSHFGVTGAGYPVNEGPALNAYADYCRGSKSALKFYSAGKKVKIYTTETIDFTNIDVIGDKAMFLNFGAFVSDDAYGFGVLTGLPSGRPPVSEVYQMDYRFSDAGGICILSDVANPIVDISSRKTHQGYGVSGWLETANQIGIRHEFNAAYQGVTFPWNNIVVSGCGGDGIALQNGIELSRWRKVTSLQNYGYGVTTAGGGGDNNQEYFWADECSFVANRLDGFLLSSFKKNVEFRRCGGNSNGWYGYGSTQSLPKPGDKTFLRGMLRVEGNILSASNLKVTDCYGEDCARMVTLQLNYPAREIEVSGTFMIPTLSLADPSSDVTNHVVAVYPLSGGSTGQIYGFRLKDNFVRETNRGKTLTGTMSPSNIFDLDFDPQQEVDGFFYDLSDFPGFNSKTKQKFNEEVTLDKHVQVGRDQIGDGSASTFVSSYVKDNIRETGQGNNSWSLSAAFLVTANWQATNSQQGGAYLVYAFSLPDGQIFGESQVIGSGAGFTSPPTVSLNGDLNVPLAANFRGSVTRIDMSGERA